MGKDSGTLLWRQEAILPGGTRRPCMYGCAKEEQRNSLAENCTYVQV
jgi:hypothetical protein